MKHEPTPKRTQQSSTAKKSYFKTLYPTAKSKSSVRRLLSRKLRRSFISELINGVLQSTRSKVAIFLANGRQRKPLRTTRALRASTRKTNSSMLALFWQAVVGDTYHGPRRLILEGLEDRRVMAFGAVLTGVDTATITGDAAADTLEITAVAGLLVHNRFTAGDAGFASNLDWDSTIAGDQVIPASSTSTITINTGSGNDIVNLGSPTLAASNLFAQFLYSSGGAGDSLTVDDGARVGANSYTSSSSSLAGTGIDVIVSTVVTGGRKLITGQGADTVLVASTFSNEPQSFDSSGGLDNVTIQGPINAAVSISNTPAQSNVTIDESLDTTARNVTVTSTSVTGLTTAPINLTAGDIQSLTVKTGTQGDVVNVSSTGVGVPTSIATGDGDDTIAIADGVSLNGGTVDGGGGIDTIDYSAFTTPVQVNLGLQNNLTSSLDGGQENPPVATAANASATVTYNALTRQATVALTANNLSNTIIDFHIHAQAIGVNGPVIVPIGAGVFVPTGIPGQYTANFIANIAASNEAAFLGGLTYFNIHTNVFPGGEIRGQIQPGTNVSIASGTATGTAGISNVENATGGAGNDSLVGSFAANILTGGAGNDTIVGGPGADTFVGGINNDTMVWNPGDGSDVMDGGADTDTVQLNGGNAAETFVVNPNGIRVSFARTSPGPFNLDVGTTEVLRLNANGGDDSVTVNNLAGVADLTTVSLFGQDGNDTFTLPAFPVSGIAVNVVGGTHPTGDILNVDAGGGPITDTGTSLTKSGSGPVNYRQIEALGISNPGNVVITGTTGNDNLVVNATGPSSGSYSLNGGPAVAFTGLTSFTFNAGNGDDTLTINNPAGGLFAPIGGIDYNGGGNPGDALQLLGGGGAGINQSYFVGTTTPPIGAGPGNNGDGLIRFTGSSAVDIRFTGLAPIVDTVVAASLTVFATDAANNISVTNGVAPRLVVAVDAFEPIEFNNKTQLIINGGDGVAGGDLADNILLNFSNLPAGLTGITINADEGADAISAQAISNVAVALNGGAGLDIINVGNNGTLTTPGLLTPVAGPVTVNGGTDGANLIVDGTGAAVAADYTITGTTVTRTVPAGFGGVTYSNLSNLRLATGAGANIITVSSTSVPTLVETNAGVDSILVGPGANTLDNILGALTVNGGGNAGDSLTLNDTADATANTYDIFTNQINRTGIPAISYAGLTNVSLLAGTNNDRVNVRTTLTGTTYNIETNAGSDTVNVHDGALLDGIDGQVNISTGSGFDFLFLIDGNDADADTYTVTRVGAVTEITFGDGDAAVDVRYDVVGGPGQLENFTLLTGGGDDVLLINNTTATNSNTFAGSDGNDRMVIAGDNLTADNRFSGDNGVDDFELNIVAALAGTSVTIEGNNTSLNPALRDQLRINDSTAGRAITLDKGDAATELNVAGLGTLLQTNTLENLVYAGTNATAAVRGSAGTDDITIAGRTGSAQVFFGGNPWDGPTEGPYAGSLPGLAGPAGTRQSPDMLLLGLQVGSNISVSGDGGVDDQVYFYGSNEADLLDPANAGQPVFRGVGFANGVLVPGVGAGNAFENMFVSDTLVQVFNPTLGPMVGLAFPTPTNFSQTNPLNPGLIVNTGDEAAPDGNGIADQIDAVLSSNFRMQINGGQPPLAGAPAGDQLRIFTPGTAQVYSDKVVNVTVNGPGLLGIGFSSIERTLVVPGNRRVELIGDNNDPAVDQTDHFIVVGQDVNGDGEGTNEFSLRINGDTVAPNPPAIYLDQVDFLDVFGADLTGADAGQVDTLEITPWADNTPRGWGIATTFDEDAPAGADGDAVDLLIIHTSLFGGPVSERIVIQPSGVDEGEVIITNASFGTPIANIAYIANTDIIVTDDDGFLSDTDSLILRGTNVDPVKGLSGNNFFTADFTADGDAANPLVSVFDGGNLLYRLRTNALPGAAPLTFDAITLEGLAGADTFSVIGRDDGSLRIIVDGGNGANNLQLPGTIGSDGFIFTPLSSSSAEIQALLSTALVFTQIHSQNIAQVVVNGGGTGADFMTVNGTNGTTNVSVAAVAPGIGSFSFGGAPLLDYGGFGNNSGITYVGDIFSGSTLDTFSLTGTFNADSYAWTPTSNASGVLQLTSGNSTFFNIFDVGQVNLDAAGAVDTLVATTANAVITPSSTPGSGLIAATDVAGAALVPLSYSNVENTTVTGGTAVIDGTDANDNISVSAAGIVTVTNNLGFANSVDVSAFGRLVINAKNGDDTITIAPSALFPAGIQVIGGVNGNGSDVLNVSGADPVVDLESSTVTGVVGGPINFTGIEHLNVTSTASITINGRNASDELTVTPTGANTTRIVPSVGGLMSINTDNPGTLLINTVGGADGVTVTGTPANDTINVNRSAVSQVQVGALKAVQISNHENLRVLSGDGNDTINVTGTGFTGFLQVDGGANSASDTVNVTNSTAGATTFTPGTLNDAYSVSTPDGAIEVLGSELVVLNGAAAGDTLTANGTHGNDTIAVQFLGGANRIWLNAFPVVSFTSFGTVNLNGRFGDDKFNVLPVGLVGVTTIGVTGGDSTDGDSVVVSGSAAAEAVTVTPTGPAAATVAGLGGIGINIASTERLLYNGIGSVDTLTIQTPIGRQLLTVTPGALVDQASIRTRNVAALGGGMLIPIDYQNLGLDGAGLPQLLFTDPSGTRVDDLTVEGLNSSDNFFVSAAGVVDLDSETAGLTVQRLPVISTVGVSSLNLHGLDGDDNFNVAGNHPFSGGLFVDGGNPSASDTLNFVGAGAAVSIDFATATVTETGFGPVSTAGVEHVNINAAAGNLAVTTSASSDLLEVTPGTNAATFRLLKSVPAIGSTPVVNADNIGTLSIDLGAGSDELSVKGTAAAEAITVTGALVTVGLLETVNYSNAEALSVYGQQGNDAFTVTPGAIPIFIDGGDPIGTIPGDSLTVNAAVGFFPGPENDEGGVITAGGTVSFDHIEELIVAGIVGCPFLILGTNGDDDITVIARDASTTAGADGVQDFTFSVNGGMNVVMLNQPDLYIDAMAGDDDIVIRTAAPNEADWDVNVRVAGGSPSMGAPAEADRLVLETPNAAGGFDNIVFNPTGSDTGNLVIDENANGTYDPAGTDSLITFGAFVFNCPPAGFVYTSSAGGVELVQYNGEGAPGIDDNITINGTALDDTTVVNPTGIGSGTFTSGASPLFQFQSFDNLTINPGAGGFDSVEINGTAGPDIVTSNANTVSLGGSVTLGAGIDQLDINTFDGNDNIDLDLQLVGLRKVIRAGEGNDTVNLSGVIADPTDPIIYGGDGDDVIVGSPNVDYIYGGSGNDTIQGLGDDDYIEGGEGNDTITGGTGNDVIHGGAGSDVIIWNNGDNTDVVEGGTGDDRAVVNGAAAGDTFTIFADATNPTRIAFNRTNLVPFALDIADVEELDVNSGSGADSFTVGDLTTTALRQLDLDLGVEAGIADTVTVNGRSTADNIQITGAGNVMTIAGLRYDVRVINALAADNDDFTFSANSGDDSVVAADSVAGFFTSSNVAVNNHFRLLGGDGNDHLSGYGLLSGQAGDDTLIGSATIAAASGNQLLLGGDGDDTMVGGTGNDTFDGGAGVDTILVRGTPGNDVIDISQTADVTLVQTVNGAVETDTLVLAAGTRTVERVHVQAGDGNDTIRVQWADALGTDAAVNSLLVKVDGGPGATGDRLGVVDLGTGDLILVEQGNTSDSGAMSVGPGNAEPLIVTYSNVETAQPIPAADGDIVVFKHDPFEFNNIRTAATYLGANSSINVDPTINPGLDPSFGFPADEDWYRVVAEKTGVLDFQVYFRQVATVPSGRPGLPNAGNLDIAVTDAAGNVIAGFGANDATSDERIRIPAVQGQTYYLRVFANGTALNVYNITVMNYAPPVPRDIELLDNPVGDPPPANSDTGRSQFDNVTRDNTPTLVFRLDDGILLNDIQGNSPAGNNPPNGVVIPIPFQAAAGVAGYRIAIFDEGSSPAPGTQVGTPPQVPLGFATFVSPGVYQFTTPVLSDGSHFLTARVQIVDPSAPQQTGFGERSAALEIIVDTVVPPGFFGQINLADTTQGLAAESDSGVVGYPATFVDRVTNDTTPSVYGRAEANAIVRVYAETNGIPGLQSSGAGADLFLGLTVAEPLDGTNQFPGGKWSFTTPLDLNNPNLGFTKDGARSLYMTAEDLAGNTTADVDADRLNIFLDTAGPQVTDVEVTGFPAFNLFGLKPDNAIEGPTPRVDSLTIRVQDFPNRSNLDPNFLYAALQQAVAVTPGNIVLRGDHSGIIAIQAITFVGNPVVDGARATGFIELDFFAPLPDDRYTLTIKDNVVDPVGNKLDGESNAAEPIGNPNFASGDGQPGRDFVARFTVDSRPEIGTVSQGLVYVDINGNFEWDPTGKDNDAVNRDFVMQMGTVTDAHFAGDFAVAGAAASSGYDKLGVYGIFNGVYSFLIDTDDDGVGDVASAMPPAYQVNGIPVAGNFSAAHPGDEIGLFDGSFWYLDTNGNNQIDLGERFASNFNGIPVVGDFNGDGNDDLATYVNDTNTFHFDLDRNGTVDVSWNVRDTLLRFGGLSGFTDRPVAGDLNLDGVDDLGLWVKGRSGQLPGNAGEYFFWISDRVAASPLNVFDAFSPAPLGNDLFAQFGDENALPIFGNFDPPVSVNNLPDVTGNYLHNASSPLDVNRDGRITPADALLIINALNSTESISVEKSIRSAASFDYRKIDTSNNGRVTPADALLVINLLNSRTTQGEGEGEGEGDGYAAQADDYFAQFDAEELHAAMRRGRR